MATYKGVESAKQGRWVFGFAVLVAGLLAVSTAKVLAAAPAKRAAKVKFVGPDLMIQDDAMDVGAEPYNINPMWLSPSIWVNTGPAPGYNAVPFSGAEPAWVTASKAASTSAEYRDPLYSTPNFVYVKVKNVGTSASSGNERLKIYWASASTGLSWPGSWSDNVQNVAGKPVLFGQEVTKPRINATTATQAERDDYRDALLAIANPASEHPGAPGSGTFWLLQQDTHACSKFPDTTFRSFSHHQDSFACWHREMMNRFEGVLQQYYPKVKLLYWDWSSAGSAASIFGYPSFIGTGSGVVGAPLFPALNPNTGTVSRNNSGASGPSDAPLLLPNVLTYAPFQFALEQSGRHDSMHPVIGPTMSNPTISAKDPYFYFLHANVDRLWAMWQRQDLVTRTDPASAFDGSSYYPLSHAMGPWADPWQSNAIIQPPVSPWTAGLFAVSKTGSDRSILSPPIYDTSPLRVPILQPGQEVVLEIPWYPPNPAAFGAIVDPEHVCLLARIETSLSAPYGMTVPETNDIAFNTVQNNNIAWRNISVVDNFVGAFKKVHLFVANLTGKEMMAGLAIRPPREANLDFFRAGSIRVNLGPELMERWVGGGKKGEGVDEIEGSSFVRLSGPRAVIRGLRLKPNETFSVAVEFQLNKDYSNKQTGRLQADVVQFATGSDGRDKVVGGQRFELDLTKLPLIKRGSVWDFREGNQQADENWKSADFRAEGWSHRKTDIGFGERPKPGQAPEARVRKERQLGTTLFRKTFEVEDPSFYRSLHLLLKYADGATASLNGKEIFRDNLPADNKKLRAMRPRKGLEGNVFHIVRLNPELIVKGTNVLAVEVRRAPGSEGMNFDAEVDANWNDPNLAPAVQFSSLWDGKPLPAKRDAAIVAQALPGSDPLASVSLYANDKLVQTVNKAPFTFHWKPPLGDRRLRVVAKDAAGRESSEYASIFTMSNVPPSVELTSPTTGTAFQLSDDVQASATATDVDGTIKEIRFFVMDHASFTSPEIEVGRATKAPFRVSLKGLGAGDYMLWAVAIDNKGAKGASMPIMVRMGRKGH